MTDFSPWQDPSIIRHTQRLLTSFHHWTGTSLLPTAAPEIQAQALFEASFVVVSHGTQADPIFNYGNRPALDLWQLDWHRLTQLPSRLSAEPMEQAERDRLLATARTNGYIDNYRGIRISSTGKRFWIENALIWDVLDENRQCCGQAATFSHWTFLP